MTIEPIDFYREIDRIDESELARNQREPERAARVLTKSHERRLARNARRLKHAEASGQRRPVFKLDVAKIRNQSAEGHQMSAAIMMRKIMQPVEPE